jgi:hypothetical protein
MLRLITAVTLLLTAAPAMAQPTLCPNGSYVSGPSCQLAPNGTWVGDNPQLTPNGTWVGGGG